MQPSDWCPFLQKRPQRGSGRMRVLCLTVLLINIDHIRCPPAPFFDAIKSGFNAFRGAKDAKGAGGVAKGVATGTIDGAKASGHATDAKPGVLGFHSTTEHPNGPLPKATDPVHPIQPETPVTPIREAPHSPAGPPRPPDLPPDFPPGFPTQKFSYPWWIRLREHARQRTTERMVLWLKHVGTGETREWAAAHEVAVTATRRGKAETRLGHFLTNTAGVYPSWRIKYPNGGIFGPEGITGIIRNANGPIARSLKFVARYFFTGVKYATLPLTYPLYRLGLWLQKSIQGNALRWLQANSFRVNVPVHLRPGYKPPPVENAIHPTPAHHQVTENAIPPTPAHLTVEKTNPALPTIPEDHHH